MEESQELINYKRRSYAISNTSTSHSWPPISVHQLEIEFHTWKEILIRARIRDVPSCLIRRALNLSSLKDVSIYVCTRSTDFSQHRSPWAFPDPEHDIHLYLDQKIFFVITFYSSLQRFTFKKKNYNIDIYYSTIVIVVVNIFASVVGQIFKDFLSKNIKNSLAVGSSWNRKWLINFSIKAQRQISRKW